MKKRDFDFGIFNTFLISVVPSWEENLLQISSISVFKFKKIFPHNFFLQISVSKKPFSINSFWQQIRQVIITFLKRNFTGDICIFTCHDNSKKKFKNPSKNKIEIKKLIFIKSQINKELIFLQPEREKEKRLNYCKISSAFTIKNPFFFGKNPIRPPSNNNSISNFKVKIHFLGLGHIKITSKKFEGIRSTCIFLEDLFRH